jgi:hypothetical protein
LKNEKDKRLKLILLLKDKIQYLVRYNKTVLNYGDKGEYSDNCIKIKNLNSEIFYLNKQVDKIDSIDNSGYY